MSGKLIGTGYQIRRAVVYKVSMVSPAVLSAAYADEFLRLVYVSTQLHGKVRSLVAKVPVKAWEKEPVEELQGALAGAAALLGGKDVVKALQVEEQKGFPFSSSSGDSVDGCEGKVSQLAAGLLGTSPSLAVSMFGAVEGFPELLPDRFVSVPACASGDVTLVVRSHLTSLAGELSIDPGGYLNYSVGEDRVVAAVFSRKFKVSTLLSMGGWLKVGCARLKGGRAIVIKGPIVGRIPLAGLFGAGQSVVATVLLSGSAAEGAFCGLAEELAAGGMLLGACENATDYNWGDFRYNEARVGTAEGLPPWWLFLERYADPWVPEKHSALDVERGSVELQAIAAVCVDESELAELEALVSPYVGFVVGTVDGLRQRKFVDVWLFRFGEGELVDLQATCSVQERLEVLSEVCAE